MSMTTTKTPNEQYRETVQAAREIRHQARLRNQAVLSDLEQAAEAKFVEAVEEATAVRDEAAQS